MHLVIAKIVLEQNLENGVFHFTGPALNKLPH